MFGTLSLFAQKPDTTNVRSPRIVCKVKLGQSAGFENQSVQFAKVISDSRCPKNVTCVWAGEAKVLINIFKNEVLVESREIVLAPGTEVEPLLSLENKKVGIYSLDPYPNAKTPKTNKKYVLNLIVAKVLE